MALPVSIKSAEMLGPYSHKEEVGDEHDRLTIMSPSFRVYRGGKFYRFHLCKCICGKVTVVPRGKVLNRNSTSCGCYRRERAAEANTYHGYCTIGNPLRETYIAYTSMVNRAEVLLGYERIKVCKRWIVGENGLDGFQCFLADMGPKPGPDYSVDRKRSKEGYEPSNCQWLLMSENLAKREWNNNGCHA
jgi:hypothetical protein